MYDPLLRTYPKPWQGYPDSYWSNGMETPAENPLSLNINADVAIIGGGFAGLSSAYHLKSMQPSLKVVVLEANSVGWGASGRNGGFVLPGTGRLSLAEMEKKWGQSTTREIYQEFHQSIDTVNQMICAGNIQCDQTFGGYLKLAHTEAAGQALEQQLAKLQDYYAGQINLVKQQDIQSSLLNINDMYGGVYYPGCYAVNPLKLVQGYHQLALQKGVEIYTQSPVVRWRQKSDQQHNLLTANGKVRASRVILATNGYTGKQMHPLVDKRHFPVISSIIVTRPLTTDEIAQTGFKAGLMAMDTRSLKYYYRLLPDNRLLFGGRGAIKGRDADLAVHKNRLLHGLHATFPVLKDIQAEYFWSGWISAAYDNYPRLWHSDDRSIYYTMGYCGSGVAFSTQMGKRLAQSILEPDSLPELPFWQSPLPKFPFARFRRTGLKLFYQFAKSK